ncbi:MAG: carboxy terminal-processing peptidase [Bacteroidota bacterium]
MKKIAGFVLMPLAALVLLLSYTPGALKSPRDEVTLQIMTAGLSSGHYQPLTMDDAFSEKAYKLYIERLDPGKKFLLQPDIDELAAYKQNIDDQITKGSFEFFEKSFSLINQRIKECEGYYKEILAKPFDFEQNEEFETDPDKLAYAATAAELKETWRKYLKYQVLIRLSETMDAQEKAKEKNDTTVKAKTFAEMEEDARKKVLKSNDELFKRYARFDRGDRIAVYLNTICNLYDPHTEFYPPADKENFDITMSGKLEGIGAQLQEKDGQIRVSNIVPGSASWRQGQLKAGDVILKVGQGAQEPVDVTDMKLDDVVKMVRGKKGTEVRLTVKKVDGSITVISIIRDIVVLEDTYAQSAVIETGRKIGYIRLASFYNDFKGGRNCSDDVKKELLKLKEEGVQGIILDLRDNGGGSLQDVINMAGFFIAKGPVVQVKQKDFPPVAYSDKDPAVIYDGPLMVMVNENSASASEIMAAAIQDYKRGVVIGSNTTFGKGTVQQFMDLDEYVLPQFDTLKPLGQVKLTIQKFYRINGGTTQLKGVVPDITLPDILRYLEYGEKELEYPMPYDGIKAANYDRWNKKIDLGKLAKNSQARVNKNEFFKFIEQTAKELKADRDNSKVPLQLSKYREENKKRKENGKKFEELQKEIPDMKVSNTLVDQKIIEADTVKSARNKDWLKNLKKDQYLYESMKVMEELAQ